MRMRMRARATQESGGVERGLQWCDMVAPGLEEDLVMLMVRYRIFRIRVSLVSWAVMPIPV